MNRLTLRYPRTATAILALMIASVMTPPAFAESVIFSGIEASSATSHAYLGFITPAPGKRLSEGVYRKFVASSTTYRYPNDERGPQVDIEGKVNGIEAGLGRAWRSSSATADLSATLGYRDVSLSPYAPTNDRAGARLTFNPQLMLWSQLSSGIDTDLLANYATGSASSFVRTRVGVHPAENYRVGIEGKWLHGRNYMIHKQGVFIAFKFRQSLTLELNAGREHPENRREASYAGIAIATTF